jgi:Tfp pilus assembly protein PilN
VQLLDHISRSLPEMLWLTDLKQDGSFITIEGRTTTLIGLSDFVGNLGTNAVLQKPIEIMDSGAESAAEAARSTVGPELIRFKVRASVAGLPERRQAKGKK